jgi:tetratricopeptide (TPR) repeat protein
MKIGKQERILQRNCTTDYYCGAFPPIPVLSVLMRPVLSKPDLSHMTANERALFKCQRALELKDKADYTGAQEVMRPLWNGVGERPDLEGLHPSVAAEVLLCAGILTGWIGSKDENKDSNEWARDLLTESVTYYESFQDALRIAAVQAELGYCYWRAGALEEARIWFSEALARLPAEGYTRANALFGLSVVEWSASRFRESLRILTENAPLFKKLNNHALKGVYHMQVGMALRNLATPESRGTELDRVLWEYAEFAARHAIKTFEKSGHQFFLAEALTTHGIALARLGNTASAQFTLQRAIEVAHQAGSLNRAGLAALTLIEEVHDLSADMLSSAYEQAVEWLAQAQSYALLLRFKVAGSKLAARLRTNATSGPTETLLKRRKCKEELVQIEEAHIRKALAEANGSVTNAARLVGVTYPGLIYIINHRHPHLLDERNPVRQRQRRK